MDYFFKTEKLTVGYNRVPLIEDMTIALKKGQILTLIGANGAGKSTVLKSIARQLEVVAGTIQMDGVNITGISLKELSKKMAVVLTDKIKTELMTCKDVVASGRYPYTGYFGFLSKKDQQIIEEAMHLVQVMELKDKDFNQISDGQRQRVMLARAICQEPEIIILDEPTSYLDVKYKLEFLSILQQMKRKKGMTVIMSLHELELASKISDQILCLKGKYVDRYGTPEEIFTKGYIKELFQITSGSFDEGSGNMELEPVREEPDVFVIAGCGLGGPVFRRLQRAGKSFVTGIIHTNDLDYPIAKALASRVIPALPFEPVTESAIKEAKECIRNCKQVICCKDTFGTYEVANQQLYEYAIELQKLSFHK